MACDLLFLELARRIEFCSSVREMSFSVGRVRVSVRVHFLAYYTGNITATLNSSNAAKMSSQRYTVVQKNDDVLGNSIGKVSYYHRP